MGGAAEFVLDPSLENGKDHEARLGPTAKRIAPAQAEGRRRAR
ncbi:MAG: hypothetical protein O9972_62385 [Burkholderiales bacterium]|nr:hypothetical protein [Burkholderiales bacterium]